jgi:hypothetical protein
MHIEQENKALHRELRCTRNPLCMGLILDFGL